MWDFYSGLEKDKICLLLFAYSAVGRSELKECVLFTEDLKEKF